MNAVAPYFFINGKNLLAGHDARTLIHRAVRSGTPGRIVRAEENERFAAFLQGGFQPIQVLARAVQSRAPSMPMNNAPAGRRFPMVAAGDGHQTADERTAFLMVADHVESWNRSKVRS